MQFSHNYDILAMVRANGLVVLDNCPFDTVDDFEKYLKGIAPMFPFAYTSTKEELVSVIDNTGKQTPQAGRSWNERPAGDWHIDTVFTDDYPEIACLYGHQITPGLGNTWFADSRRALNGLSPDFLGFLRSLKIVHYRQPNRRYTQQSWEQQYPSPTKEQLDTAFQKSTRPLIMHDSNDNEYLMLSPSKAVRFDGWTEEESRGIIEFLTKHITMPEYTITHEWKPRQLVLWVNNVMNHYGIYDYHGCPRILWRAYLK